MGKFYFYVYVLVIVIIMYTIHMDFVRINDNLVAINNSIQQQNQVFMTNPNDDKE